MGSIIRLNPDSRDRVVDTDIARYWPSRQHYLGTLLKGLVGVRALHFPDLYLEVVVWHPSHLDVS